MGISAMKIKNVKEFLFIHVLHKCTDPKLRTGFCGLQLKKENHAPGPELMLYLPSGTHLPIPNTWTKSKRQWLVN